MAVVINEVEVAPAPAPAPSAPSAAPGVGHAADITRKIDRVIQIEQERRRRLAAS
jgi:hypothetical protein